MLPTGIPQWNPTPTRLKEEYWKKLGHMDEHIPTKECLFVLVDANARTGKRMSGCGDGRVLGAYGRDDLNNIGNRLLTFAKITSSLSRTCFVAHGRVEYHIRSTASAAATTKNGLTTP